MAFRVLIPILLCFLICHSNVSATKRIKAKGDYVHTYAKATFPLCIQEFDRTEIYAIDKDYKNIAATYELYNTKVNVYLYPAGPADNHRFRGEYHNSLVAAGTDVETIAHHQCVRYKKGMYCVNGFQAYVNAYSTNVSGLRLYECGTWFLKIRITSYTLDTAEVTKLFEIFIQQFDPAALVTIAPLSTRSEMKITPTALRDKTLVGCTFATALAKISWALENVDSFELQSGFPSLYLDMYISSLKAFVNDAEEHAEWPRTEKTKKHLSEIRSLIESQYIDEYIMDEFRNLMIVANNKEFDFAGYYQWRKTHPISYSIAGAVLDKITYIPFSEL